MLKLLEFARMGGDTTRFHTFPLINTDTVASHSFGVAWLCVVLSGGPDNCPKELLVMALSHDLAEHKIGDVRADAKRKSPVLKQELDRLEDELLEEHGLTGCSDTDLYALLKLADNFDGLLFLLKEISMGNKNNKVVEAFRNYARYLWGTLSYEDANPIAVELLEKILAEAFAHGITTEHTKL